MRVEEHAGRCRIELQRQLIEWRRHFHRNPELSFQEIETARFVATTLSGFEGMTVRTGVGKTGVVATLSNGPGKTVAIRADMDALPITEKSNHDYVSKNQGVMHACGHDAHTAILLGVAKVLAEKAKVHAFTGTIKLLFQPAEEATDHEGLSGAPRMMQEGALDDVDNIIALHVCPWHEVGVIQVNAGYSMASVDVFHATIRGTGGHGGYPHVGTDPVWMLGSVLQAFYSLPTRRLSPLDIAVASIGEINAGSASNVIPADVSVTGTLRAYCPKVREQLIDEVEKAFSIVEPLGGAYTFSVVRGEPALSNDSTVTQVIKEVVAAHKQTYKIVEEPFGLGGEDFGYMTQVVPGAMFFLGCMLPDGIRRDLHTNQFDIDERCLEIGVDLLVDTAIALLYRSDN